LFAGQDWLVLYRAFTEVNFNASDPASINDSLRSYIQTNYPENFNDWIESSEFIAIIELLSWLAGTLAFKTDINARENFLENAETRESILRLARFISYNPRRNQPATGLLKLVEVSTDDDLTDSFGASLNNVPVQWDNPDDADWFERFTTIMNSAFNANHQYGVPLKKGTVGDVLTQSYRFNNVMAEANLSFSAKVSGTSMNFEVVNADFDDGGGFYERTPGYGNSLNVFYRNDGTGNSSANTGFFFLFKQGSTFTESFFISTPIENQVIDLGNNNVNETDVWVQTINDNGSVLTEWSKVPAIYNQNITYNNYEASVRDIYSVITRDNDAVSLRFSDGRFGSVPTGNLRVWYRVSNGLTYQIKPSDISRVEIPLKYYNRNGVQKTLTMVFALEETVSNSTPRETEAQIKARAPSVYATQNRMVSGEDYNTFPLQSNLAVKLKALNRVYSGHSRFIDLNDPTGNYQDVNVFSDDGIFFKEKYNTYVEIPITLNQTAPQLVTSFIQPILDRQETLNYMQDRLLDDSKFPSPPIPWEAATSAAYSSTGSFPGAGASSIDYIASGATLKFQDPAHPTSFKWATVVSIIGAVNNPPAANTPGPVTLSLAIPTGWEVIEIVPRFSPTLDSTTISEIQDKINDNQSFSLYFDSSVNPNDGVRAWGLIGPEAGDVYEVMTVSYSAGGTWGVNANGIRYIFESLKNVEFYNDGRRSIDNETGNEQNDLISVLKYNEDLNSNTGSSIGKDYELYTGAIYLNRDGTPNPARTVVRFADANLNGHPDNPDTYNNIILQPVEDHSNYLFWQTASNDTMPIYNVHLFDTETDRRNANATIAPVGTLAFQIDSDVEVRSNTFWVRTATSGNENGWNVQPSSAYSYAIGRGPNVAVNETPSEALNFKWKHYAIADHRIDPARTNINDIFVLTSEYDYLTRLWISQGADVNAIPVAPTELDLRLMFTEFEDYRMFSDQIVWRPVKYKLLFGNGAADELRTQFKVVKLASTTLSDGEISSRIVRAINEFFAVQFWDFGSTFYFTELAAYIHQQLANVIASVALVPLFESAAFGDGFEIRCRSDELFISTAQVSDIVIIDSNTANNLRIR
jgi:hypothetical protein